MLRHLLHDQAVSRVETMGSQPILQEKGHIENRLLWLPNIAMQHALARKRMYAST